MEVLVICVGLEVEKLVEGREEEMEERVLGREVEQHWQRILIL